MTNNKGLCVTSRCSKATSQGTLMPAISTNWAKQSEGEATAILQLSKLLRNPSKVCISFPFYELPLLAAATPTIVIVQFAKTKARTSQSVRGSTFGHQAEYSNRAPSWSSIYPFAYQEPTACCSLCPCPSEIYCPKYPELS
ncbi:hypothetical protein V1477_001292 [Vespula maculifrons]|uniref:Uncharacterized protein n=1 Tax=Vespula maculifrons TaxID=7453 RepID=A0ABD2CZE2_VESMC